MKTFLVLVSLPTPTVQAVAAMDSEVHQRRKLRRLIEFNQRTFLKLMEDTLLDQINNPRELASLHQGPGGESVHATSRPKGSVDELPETHEGGES